jgi:hypothetical protein
MMNSIADRLLGLVAPKATARAACQPHTTVRTWCSGGLRYRQTCHILASCDDRCSTSVIGTC